MDRKITGFSLIELLVVIGIFSILLLIAIPLYREWVVKYRIESNVKDIYNFLQEARNKAFVEKIKLDAEVSSGKLCIKCDTSDDDCTSMYGNDSIKCIALLSDYTGKTVNISKRGTLSGGPIYYGKANGARYDCIRISDVRIKMDKCNGSP